MASPANLAASEESARLETVQSRLESAADGTGFLTFDRFTEIALYSPGAGYYETRDQLGARGDFYTAAHVHPMFGATIADRIRAEFEALGRPHRFRVVEVGPGDGQLAHDILVRLASSMPEGHGWEYVLVEPSGGLRRRLLERLAPVAGGATVRLAAGLGADGPFSGVVLANELLDAFPARRLVRRGSEWRELGVRRSDPGWAWAEADALPLAAPPLAPGAADGTILEVAPAAEGFLREIGDHLESGAALLLDYGAEESELAHGHPRGTLAAVRDHRPLDDPLSAPGSADLSAFVNFTRIEAAARTSGLTVLHSDSQAEALGRWGFEARRDAAIAAASTPAEKVRVQLAAKNLLFGFATFRVLELAPGIPAN